MSPSRAIVHGLHGSRPASFCLFLIMAKAGDKMNCLFVVDGEAVLCQSWKRGRSSFVPYQMKVCISSSSEAFYKKVLSIVL